MDALRCIHQTGSVSRVANVSTPFKRLFLRKLAWDSEKSGNSLFDGLKAAAIASIEDSGSGPILVGTGAKGHQVTFAIPAEGRGYTPAELCAAIEELLTRYDSAVASLVASGIPTPTDAQILTEMLAMLVAITEVYADFSDLRAV